SKITRGGAEADLNTLVLGLERLPAIDALIDACAKVQDAILVHRDPHIAKVSVHLLKQELLPPKT
ncbi:MAG TPA: hypothetical protein P5534_20200, partial [Candidatus Paceibacterota bacterium]|nr:hypothetical protein [Candidatus Paceibacterota bacterium]